MDASEVISSAQMRALEQEAIASGRVSSPDLMERAGRSVAEVIFERWPDVKYAVVLCGPGNNGGDGYVVARRLHDAGWEVEVFYFGDPEKLPPDAKQNYERWCAIGPAKPVSKCLSARFVRHPVLVDALFGIGLDRPIPDELRDILMATANCPRVAIDFPSYINSDTGALLNPFPEAFQRGQTTVTFHRKKPGHVTGEGAAYCGEIIVQDIGL